MRLLLDAHALLWWLGDDKRLSTTARKAIETANDPLIGAGTLAEIAIKRSLGKLEVDEDWPEQAQADDFGLLAIDWAHATRLQELPFPCSPVSPTGIHSTGCSRPRRSASERLSSPAIRRSRHMGWRRSGSAHRNARAASVQRQHHGLHAARQMAMAIRARARGGDPRLSLSKQLLDSQVYAWNASDLQP